MRMKLPVIEGMLDRRILLNYRFDPEYLGRFVPAPFIPRIHKNNGIGGVCMIRFKELRPRHFPQVLGIDSENAAHRIAVEWNYQGDRQHGVFIPRRDTASTFNYLAGGRIFPGIFKKSVFRVKEGGGHYRVEIADGESEPHVMFDGEECPEFSKMSIFESLGEASEFFAKGAIGYSLANERCHYQGMELRLLEWHISPLQINQAYVKMYEDEKVFPKGTAQIDSAMIMKRLRHEWHNIPEMRAE